MRDYKEGMCCKDNKLVIFNHASLIYPKNFETKQNPYVMKSLFSKENLKTS